MKNVIAHSHLLISNSLLHYALEHHEPVTILRLVSHDGTNRLTRACVLALTAEIRERAHSPRPLIITGSDKFFSAGADLQEIASLNGPAAYRFSHMGQALMNEIQHFPARVVEIGRAHV